MKTQSSQPTRRVAVALSETTITTLKQLAIAHRRSLSDELAWALDAYVDPFRTTTRSLHTGRLLTEESHS